MQSQSVQVMNLRRPGLAAVQKIMGWTPLHLAAAEGEVQLMESLIADHGCDVLARSDNSWTPLHYAAAHNKVFHHLMDPLSILSCSGLATRWLDSGARHMSCCVLAWPALASSHRRV